MSEEFGLEEEDLNELSIILLLGAHALFDGATRLFQMDSALMDIEEADFQAAVFLLVIRL